MKNALLVLIVFCALLCSTFAALQWSSCKPLTPGSVPGVSEDNAESNLLFKYLDKFVATKFAAQVASKLKRSPYLSVNLDSYDRINPFQDVKKNSASLEEGETLLDRILRLKAMCAVEEVPLKWFDPTDNRKIPIFFKVFPSPKPEKRKGVLVLLQGGPGGSSAVFDQLAPIIFDATDDEYDLVLPDHRGTGRSTLLACPGLQPIPDDETGLKTLLACRQQLLSKYQKSGLAGFSTTDASHDLAHFLNQTTKAGDEVIVYGVSYGTYWLNRFLSLYPNIATKAIADSVVSMNMDFVERNDHFNEAGNLLLDVCGKDAVCNAKFPNGVLQQLRIVFEKQRNPTTACVPQFEEYSGEVLSVLFSRFLSDSSLRKLILPIAYRLQRCDKTDQNVLDNLQLFLQLMMMVMEQSEISPHLKQELDMRIVNASAYDSDALFVNIAASELSNRPTPYTPNYWIEKYATNPPFFNLNFSAMMTEMVQQVDSTCYAMPTKNYATNFDRPLLIMQGTLDPQTPMSFYHQWDIHLSNAKKVLFPNAVHGTIVSTPKKDNDGINKFEFCGLDYIAKFAKSGSVDNVDCITSGESVDMPSMDFDPSIPSLSVFGIILNSDNLWEGGPSMSYRAMARMAFYIFLFTSCCCCCCLFFITAAIIGLIVFCCVRMNKTKRPSVEFSRLE